MKSFFLILIICVFSLSCSSDDGGDNRNPNIPDALVQFQIDLGLPSFDNLRFAGGSVYVPSGGVRGFFVFNLSGDQFLAWEASCPNHIPNDCSTMDIVGVFAKCSCEDYEYSMATGQLLNPEDGETETYPMVNYRVTKTGDVLTISN